jgi:hypothetical protein
LLGDRITAPETAKRPGGWSAGPFRKIVVYF